MQNYHFSILRQSGCTNLIGRDRYWRSEIRTKMAKRDQFTLTLRERCRRTFSETFKRDKVREIESGQTRISTICKQYSVSDTAVRRWLRKFGFQNQPQERLIIETMSDTLALKTLRERLAELERLVGQKQVEVEFFKKMIDLAQDHYGIEIKKNFSTQPFAISGSNENNTDSV
jgi:transposase-like protein